MATSYQTLEAFHGAIVVAQHMNEGLFRERIDTIKSNPLPIAQVMSDVRAFIGGVVAGESKPLVATAMGLIEKKKYAGYHSEADATIPPVETWVSRFDADIAALELKDSDAVRRAGQAVGKLAQQTRTLAVLAKMLELAMADAPNDSDVDLDLGALDLGELDDPSGDGDVPTGTTAIMKSTPQATPSKTESAATKKATSGPSAAKPNPK